MNTPARPRTATTPIPLTERPQAPRSWVGVLLSVLTVALAVLWYTVVNASMEAGARAQNEAAVNGADALLGVFAEDVQLRLRTESQLMSEDPRLKSTLATPGIDEATIQDVLTDLRRQTNADFIAVLNPAARVQAEVGAGFLRGLDLSTSSVVKGAQVSADSVGGAWVVADRLVDVSAKAIRFGNQVVAYLMVGAPQTEATLQRVYQVTGSGCALLVGGKVSQAYPATGSFQGIFGSLAAEPAAFGTRVMSIGGKPYVVRLADVKNTQQRARVVIVRPAQETPEPYENARYLAYVPALAAALLTAVAVLRGRLFR